MEEQLSVLDYFPGIVTVESERTWIGTPKIQPGVSQYSLNSLEDDIENILVVKEEGRE